VFLILAGYGMHPLSRERVLSVSKSKRVNAIMQLCGFYDEAGAFSFKVGLITRSGCTGVRCTDRLREYICQKTALRK
jgi:glutaminase